MVDRRQFMRGAALGALAFTGTSAKNSVVNSYGQTHELPNLYMAGPGIFATAGASNPTYTIFALSLRGAEQLAAKWTSVI
jgi:choline dehydrogenase-like flavoprotein